MYVAYLFCSILLTVHGGHSKRYTFILFFLKINSYRRFIDQITLPVNRLWQPLFLIDDRYVVLMALLIILSKYQQGQFQLQFSEKMVHSVKIHRRSTALLVANRCLSNFRDCWQQIPS